MTLTSSHWKEIDKKAKALAKEYSEGFDESKYGKGEIYSSYDGAYEQREYGGNFYTLEGELEDIIKEVLEDDGMDSEELYKFDARMVDGFTELVIDFEGWVTDLLPNDWYIYYEDGDIWVARNWQTLEDIDEDLQHLVNE